MARLATMTLRTLAAACLLAAGAAMAAAPAHAAGSDAVVFVVDETRSLDDGSGSHAATGGLHDVVGSMGDDTPMGLIGFGQSCSGGGDLAIPVRSGQRAVLDRAVDDLRIDFPDEEPLIGVRQGVRALSAHGGGQILLVTDGVYSCPAPPLGWCEAIGSVVPDGYVVNVIGYNARGTGELECIAEATGGSYTTAEGVADLTDEIVDVVESESGSGPGLGGPLAVTAVLAAGVWFVATHTTATRSGRERRLRRLVGVTPRPMAPARFEPARAAPDQDDRALELRPRTSAWRWSHSGPAQATTHQPDEEA